MCVCVCVQVRFIDTGEMKIVKVSQLCSLPNHLLSLAAQVVEVIVCGMSPCDQDNDWPPRVSVCVCVYV